MSKNHQSKPKSKAYIVVQGRTCGVFTHYDDVLQSTHKFTGQVQWKVKTIEEARRQYSVLCHWRSFSEENKAEILCTTKAKKIINEMLSNPGINYNDINAALSVPAPVKEPIKAPIVASPTKLTLACDYGAKDIDTTITRTYRDVVNTIIVPMPSGSTYPRKLLELTSAVIKLADDDIKSGVDTVEITGLSDGALRTLLEHSPKWCAGGWDQRPNIDLIKSIYEIYLNIKSKVLFDSEFTTKLEQDGDIPF